MSREMNDKNNKKVTGEELETVNGGVGLNVCSVPRRPWDRKRGGFFLPPDVPVDDEPRDGGATGSW